MATILIAEPDLTHGSVMQATLEGEGHTVHTALDGHEALELCASARPDLLFLAVNLPILTGPEVAESLRNDPDFDPDLPIVLLHSEDLDRRLVERCGATGTLERGAEAHTLRERVVDLLGPNARAR